MYIGTVLIPGYTVFRMRICKTGLIVKGKRDGIFIQAGKTGVGVRENKRNELLTGILGNI